MPQKRLFCVGFGFSAAHLVRRLQQEQESGKGWRIAGTCRSEEKKKQLEAEGIEAFLFSPDQPLDPSAFDGTTHLLASAPPNEIGDPFIKEYGDALMKRAPDLEWAGYLSTTGVYGDRGGDWVDESSALAPTTARGEKRLTAECDWLSWGEKSGVPVHLFRLAGIYGPYRNQMASLRQGKARRVVKPGQIFSRIHVEDIAGILQASIAKPNAGAAYNVCDDEAAPPQDVVAYAASLMGIEPPPEIPFEEADLSPMAKSFYEDVKRVSNKRLKEELGVTLRYPTYREGLKTLYEAGEF